ncbi:MAG: hypothetical protein HYW05_03225 [Candidatus Diapherotrites archaeon]|nr:hypothetical protein [Candidatus Diapherotrites archaeon]
MRVNKIFVYDTTLRDGVQTAEGNLNWKQKLKFARFLGKNRQADVIECGFPAAHGQDFKAVKKISESCALEKWPVVISAISRCKLEDVEKTVAALEPAISSGRGRIYLFIAGSTTKKDKTLGLNIKSAKKQIVESIKYAKELYPGLQIQYCAVDAVRLNWKYLLLTVLAAESAGAKIITLADSPGFALPLEYYSLVKRVKEKVRDRTILSVHTHNDLGLAVANTILGIQAGAKQAEVTVAGIGERAGNAQKEAVIASLLSRRDYFHKKINFQSENALLAVEALKKIIKYNPLSLHTPVVGEWVSKHASGIHQDWMKKDPFSFQVVNFEQWGKRTDFPLTINSSLGCFIKTLKSFGIKKSDNDIFQAFKKYKKSNGGNNVITEEFLEKLFD